MTTFTDEQILQMCYDEHTQFKKSPEHDEFFLANSVVWPFSYVYDNGWKLYTKNSIETILL